MLYLASKSPRRRELLGHLGADFEVVDVDVPEHRGAGESALDYVARVARDKALAGLARVGRDADAVVIGADTEVILDDAVFGKPADDADAAAMLRRLSGRTHDAVSAVSVVSAMGEEGALCVSEVTFAVLDEPTIARYIATGEPHGKAGAYAIQGAAQSFIAHLSGSHSGVMGLPLHETASLLRAFNVIAEGGVLPRIGAEDDADPAVPSGVATTGASAASARSAPPPSSAAAGSASASAPILGKEKSPQQTQGTDER